MVKYDFCEWYNDPATSAKDKALADKVMELDGLFDDMRFASGSITAAQLLRAEDEEGHSYIDSAPDELEYFDVTQFRYRVKPSRLYNGCFNRKSGILRVTPESLENESVILHEMIHMYESVIDKQLLYFHDALIWVLYQELIASDKISREELDLIISGHIHILNELVLYEQGGMHDLLFMLKSFELDIKKGYPLGTVFGYDLDKQIAKASEKTLSKTLSSSLKTLR